MNSLTTLVGFAAQAAQGTPGTNVQTLRATAVDSTPSFEEITNQNNMIGLARATAQASIPERSGFSVPLSVDFGLYPRSLCLALYGIGFAEKAQAKAAPSGHVIEHQFVKSNQEDAGLLTSYIKMGSGTNFVRQIQDTRLSQMTWTLNRQGAVGNLVGLGLREAVVTTSDYTSTAEANAMFLPFVGNMSWVDVPGAPTTAYDFGCIQEQTITFDRAIEEDDTCLHSYFRSDNQELSFSLSGAASGISFSRAFYEYMVYGGDFTTGPSAATLLTGLKFLWETGSNIPGGTGTDQPYRLYMYVPKASIMLTNFRASSNDVVRADVSWTMIDDDPNNPPVYIQLENDQQACSNSGTQFGAAQGNVTANWNTAYWSGVTPVLSDVIITVPTAPVAANTPFTATVEVQDQDGNRMTSFSGAVTLALQNDPGGNLTPGRVILTNGFWSGQLSIDKDAAGVTLQAVEPNSGQSKTSGTFTITPAAAPGPSGAFGQGFGAGFNV